MDYRPLSPSASDPVPTGTAETPIHVSAVALGTWGFAGDFHWGPQDDADSMATVHAALDEGINFFDTAESYGGGRTEEVLGRALAGLRQQVVIAGKASPEHLSTAALERACEASLRRLNTDYLDLYQLHWPNRDVPLEETVAALSRLQASGKVRAVGVSNFGVGDLGDFLAASARALRCRTNQLPYSLLWRAIEFELQPLCQQEGVGILCYSPLLHGLLTGKYASLDEMPESRARTRHFSQRWPQIRHDEEGCEAEVTAALGQISRLCRELDVPMADLAIAWLLQRPAVTAAVVGARTPAQVRQNARAAQLVLSQATVQALDEATEPVKQKLGPNPDMWQSESRYR